MNLTQIAQIFWRRKFIILFVIPIVMVIPYLFFQSLTDTFTTRSRLRIVTPSDGLRVSDTYADRLNNTLGYVINSSKIRQEVMESLGLEGDMPTARLRVIPNSEILELIVEDENPDIVNGLSDLLSDNELEIYYGSQTPPSETILEKLDLMQQELNLLFSEDQSLYSSVTDNVLQIFEENGNLDLDLGDFTTRPRFQIENLPLDVQQDVQTTVSTISDLEVDYNKALLLEQSIDQSIYVLEYANEPNRESNSNLLLVLGIAGVIGAGVGSALAIVSESLDNKLYTVDAIQHISNLTPIGYIPKSRRLRKLGKLIGQRRIISQHETFRKLRTSLRLDSQKGIKDHSQGQVLFVTSSAPQEGKSIVAANLAWVISQNRRVLLIDANLRRPTQHKIFDIEQEFGLTDFLQAHNDDRDYSVKHLSSRDFSIMTAGTPTDIVTDLIGNGRLDLLFEILRQTYDVIIVDTPAINGVADTLEMREFADRFILLATLGKTRDSSLYTTFELFNNLHITDPALVINYASIETYKY